METSPFITTLLLLHSVSCYKPVLLFHGMCSPPSSMDTLISSIQYYHPGTLTLSIDGFSGCDINPSRSNGTQPMWMQEKYLSYVISQFGHMLAKESNSDSYHLICHSQGALSCRGALQWGDMNYNDAENGPFPEQNVDTFISLAGPQAGVYVNDTFLLNFFGLKLENAYKVIYDIHMQQQYRQCVWKIDVDVIQLCQLFQRSVSLG